MYIIRCVWVSLSHLFPVGQWSYKLKLPLNFFQISMKPTWNPLETHLKLLWNTLQSSLKHIWNLLVIPLKLSWKTLENSFKLLWNFLETPLKHHWNFPGTPFKLLSNTLETCWKLLETPFNVTSNKNKIMKQNLIKNILETLLKLVFLKFSWNTLDTFFKHLP